LRHADHVAEEAMSKYRVLPDVDLAAADVRDSKGRRMTEEYAERAAAEALESIGRGRPSLTGAKVPSPQVTFRVTPELRARAAAEAARQGRRVSDVARDALEQYLAS
jgi:predicted HicB family RNase H-like nuclease